MLKNKKFIFINQFYVNVSQPFVWELIYYNKESNICAEEKYSKA